MFAPPCWITGIVFYFWNFFHSCCCLIDPGSDQIHCRHVWNNRIRVNSMLCTQIYCPILFLLSRVHIVLFSMVVFVSIAPNQCRHELAAGSEEAVAWHFISGELPAILFYQKSCVGHVRARASSGATSCSGK